MTSAPTSADNDLSGRISAQPPAIRQVIPSLVPKVDADGNEVAGVPSVLHQAPLGTYLGWNVARDGFYKGPTPVSPAATFRSPKRGQARRRPATRGRRSRSGTATTPATSPRCRRPQSALVRERFLLPDDAERLVREAEASDVLARTECEGR